MTAAAPVPADESAQLAIIGRTLFTLGQENPAALREYLEPLNAWERATAAEAIAYRTREIELGVEAAAEWRATPATMANHLTGGTYRLYRYAQLLGQRFADAFAYVIQDGYPHKPEPIEGCIPKQIWTLASQYGKTSVLMNGVIWALDHNPRLRLMYVSYDADKAVEEGGKARDLAERHSADLRFQLRPDRRARGMWATQDGGGLYCVGIHGGITGYPADGVLLDDLFKGWQAAHSPTERETVWSIYRSQVRMRLQSFWCPVLFATTRWHEDDVPARMRKAQQDDPDADQWDVLRLPTIAEAPQPDAIDPLLREADPLGRMPGELLEPQRFPAQEVAARRAVLGPYLFAGLEQQRPAPVEGTEIKRDWFRVDDDLPPAFDELISSWDMKLKDKESGDYVVGQTWGRTAGHYWLLSQLRGQWDQPTTECAIVLAQVREARIRLHVLEASGNAPEVRDALAAAREDYEVTDRVAGLLGMTEDERAAVNRWRRHGLTNVVLEPVKGDKVSRMRTHSGLIESGAVHLWSHWSGVAAYLEEVAAFPNGAHDDQVDSTSQALKRLFLGGPTRVRIPDRPVVKPPIIRRGPSSSRVVVPSRLR